jgi:SAM-dependent methyltransferase
VSGGRARLRAQIREKLERVPGVGGPTVALVRKARIRLFPGSTDYWERRYEAGGTSGSGSYGRLAHFKAEVLNAFVAEHSIQTVLEMGCGDGAQLSLADYPRYVGLDVAPSAIALCAERFVDDPTKSFFRYDPGAWVNRGAFAADLALSLDVLYHLVEESVWETHLRHLFGASGRFVGIYAADRHSAREGPHVLTRPFTPWISTHLPDWTLVAHVPNRHPLDPADPDETSIADFYFFEKNAADGSGRGLPT